MKAIYTLKIISYWVTQMPKNGTIGFCNLGNRLFYWALVKT